MATDDHGQAHLRSVEIGPLMWDDDLGMDVRERNRGIELIANPPPGSKLAAAKDYGIDLTLLLENLDLTPTERLEKLAAAQRFHEELRRAGQRQRARTR